MNLNILNDIDLTTLILSVAPALVLFGFAMIALLIGAFVRNLDAKFYVPFSLLGVILSLFSIFTDVNPYGMLSTDSLSVIAQILILLGALAYLPLFVKKSDDKTPDEFYSLFLFMLGALLLMASSFNLIFIFVALETSSLALYTIIALSGGEKANEAAIKYFSLGALSAGLFTFGAAMLYLASGSLNLVKIGEFILSNDTKENAIVLLGACFLIAAIGFKLSLVPFHTWVRDVYEGAGLWLAGFISIVPKIAASVVALRIFKLLSDAGVEYISIALSILAIATMTVANISALSAKDLRAMLSYSSVSHAGFILVAILIGSSDSVTTMFFYWIVLMFANLGAFGLLSGVKTSQNERHTHCLDKFNGAFKTNPAFALCFSVFAFALAGVPPLGLFWAKMLLISTAISNAQIIIAVIMIINSAIAAAYYLRPVVAMLLKEPNDTKLEVCLSSFAKLSIGVACIFALLGFIFADEILSAINALVLSPAIFEF